MPKAMDSPDNPDRDPRYGWVMVAVVFVLSTLAFGVLGSVSVFLKPLATEFGWGRGQTAFGYTAVAFSAALFGLFWGYVADRYGTRWFGVFAALAMSLSLYLLSKQQSIVEFYGFYFLFGALGSAVVTSPLFANVGFWFKRQPGLALGMTAAGGAFGQGIVPFLAGIAIDAYGWRSTYVLMAGAYLLIALPVGLLIRESPTRSRARTELPLSGSPVGISETEVVVWISVAIIFCCNCMAVPIVHLVPLLTDAGHDTEFATSVLMVLMFCGVLGRVLGGKLGDSIGALPGYMLMSLGQTLFVFWFTYFQQPLGLYLLAACFGFTYSGVMSSILVCTRMMVSARFAGRAMSITSFFGWFGMGLGGFVGGYLFDLTGTYVVSYGFAAVAGIVNLLVLTLFYLRLNHAGSNRERDSVPATP